MHASARWSTGPFFFTVPMARGASTPTRDSEPPMARVLTALGSHFVESERTRHSIGEPASARADGAADDGEGARAADVWRAMDVNGSDTGPDPRP